MIKFDLETVKHLRELYPEGTRVKLLAMDDQQSTPIGSIGTFFGVDDAQGVMVDWDAGGKLHMLYGVDEWEVVVDNTFFKKLLFVIYPFLFNLNLRISVMRDLANLFSFSSKTISRFSFLSRDICYFF